MNRRNAIKRLLAIGAFERVDEEMLQVVLKKI